MQTAGALAYTSVFALVPLTAAVLGILAAFPGFAGWREQITAWVFDNFVPAAGGTVQGIGGALGPQKLPDYKPGKRQ